MMMMMMMMMMNITRFFVERHMRTPPNLEESGGK